MRTTQWGADPSADGLATVNAHTLAVDGAGLPAPTPRLDTGGYSAGAALADGVGLVLIGSLGMDTASTFPYGEVLVLDTPTRIYTHLRYRVYDARDLGAPMLGTAADLGAFRIARGCEAATQTRCRVTSHLWSSTVVAGGRVYGESHGIPSALL